MTLAGWIVIGAALFLLGLAGHRAVEESRVKGVALHLRTELLLASIKHPEMRDNPTFRALSMGFMIIVNYGPPNLLLIVLQGGGEPVTRRKSPELPDEAQAILDNVKGAHAKNIFQYYSFHNPLLMTALLFRALWQHARGKAVDIDQLLPSVATLLK